MCRETGNALEITKPRIFGSPEGYTSFASISPPTLPWKTLRSPYSRMRRPRGIGRISWSGSLGLKVDLKPDGIAATSRTTATSSARRNAAGSSAANSCGGDGEEGALTCFLLRRNGLRPLSWPSISDDHVDWTAMWQARRKALEDCDGEAITVTDVNGLQLTNSDVLAGWRDDAAFRDFFIATLASTAFPAFFWETKPLTPGAPRDPFEFVLIRGDALAKMRADPSAFAGHLDTAADIVAFPNLSGRSLLIVPRQIADPDCYGHVAAFMRSAPSDQRHVLLQRLAVEAEEKLAAEQERLWISTAGLGGVVAACAPGCVSEVLSPRSV